MENMITVLCSEVLFNALALKRHVLTAQDADMAEEDDHEMMLKYVHMLSYKCRPGPVSDPTNCLRFFCFCRRGREVGGLY